jgi:hypothetical protein
MGNRQSNWYKEIGGDWGTVKIGRKWIWYDCLWCARYLYPKEFSTPRWQGPPSKAIIKASAARIGGTKVHCSGAKKHKEIIKFKEK